MLNIIHLEHPQFDATGSWYPSMLPLTQAPSLCNLSIPDIDQSQRNRAPSHRMHQSQSPNPANIAKPIMLTLGLHALLVVPSAAFATLTPPVPVTLLPIPFVQLSVPHSNPPGGQQPPPTSAPQVCQPCAHPLPPLPLLIPVGATTVTPLPCATVVDPLAGQSVRPQSRPTRQQPPW